MPAITPQFMLDLESRITRVASDDYARLTQNQWWQTITRTKSTLAGRELIWWLLSTAMIHDQGDGGNVHFSDIVSTYTELKAKFSGEALKLTRAQLEDTDANGVNLAADWSQQIGAQMAYWPQSQVSNFLKIAHDPTKVRGYDGLAFFADDHPCNIYKPAGAKFTNLFHGAASGTNPGKLPIDESVSVEVALQNLQKAYAYIASIKMPNGVQPRYLRPKHLLVPPALLFRSVQLTQAKFIAQAAGSGAASSDVAAVIQALGLALPMQADELAGDDTTYYIAAEQITADELGAVIYLEREAYHIDFYGPQTDAELNRRDEFEWHCKGRNNVGPGHPFLLFKVEGR